MIEPICAEVSIVPVSCVTMESVCPVSPMRKSVRQSRVRIRHDTLRHTPKAKIAKIAVRYRSHTKGTGGMTSTATRTTTNMPPQILAASERYSAPRHADRLISRASYGTILRIKLPVPRSQ